MYAKKVSGGFADYLTYPDFLPFVTNSLLMVSPLLSILLGLSTKQPTIINHISFSTHPTRQPQIHPLGQFLQYYQP